MRKTISFILCCCVLLTACTSNRIPTISVEADAFSISPQGFVDLLNASIGSLKNSKSEAIDYLLDIPDFKSSGSPISISDDLLQLTLSGKETLEQVNLSWSSQGMSPEQETTSGFLCGILPTLFKADKSVSLLTDLRLKSSTANNTIESNGVRYHLNASSGVSILTIIPASVPFASQDNALSETNPSIGTRTDDENKSDKIIPPVGNGSIVGFGPSAEFIDRMNVILDERDNTLPYGVWREDTVPLLYVAFDEYIYLHLYNEEYQNLESEVDEVAVFIEIPENEDAFTEYRWIAVATICAMDSVTDKEKAIGIVEQMIDAANTSSRETGIFSSDYISDEYVCSLELNERMIFTIQALSNTEGDNERFSYDPDKPKNYR